MQSRADNRTAIELFVLSAISLYVELLVIRWLSADIRAFTVFHTFPLIACFVGMGVGFARGNDSGYKSVAVAAFLFCALMKAADALGVSTIGFPSLATFQWGNLVGTAYNVPYVVFFMVWVIAMLFLPFAMCDGIGARLGALFDKMPPLRAYSINVAGAIAGSVGFQLLSNLGLAPWLQFVIASAIVVALLQWREKQPAIKQWIAVAAIPIVSLAIQPADSQRHFIPELASAGDHQSSTYWSPYQRVDLTVFTEKNARDSQRNLLGLEVAANKAFHQYFFDIKTERPFAHTALIDGIREDYALPFRFKNCKSALIVGAGTGQNVSSALEAGCADIDAVEIDPMIINIGTKYNPDYSSPYVHLFCDDARHYFSQCKKKYDVIDFSTLDSHAVSGLGSSVRIDTYVYTKESIKQALGLLQPDGVLVVSFAAAAPWTKDRLYRTFTEAAGYPPMLLCGNFSSCIFLLGPKIQSGEYKVPSGFKVLPAPDTVASRVLTDDWPYLYVRPEVVDYPYLLIMAEILLLAGIATRSLWAYRTESLNWQMFFLGSAFMLIELRSIAFLSLLYGSTWVTSAIVINGALAMIWIANFVVIKLGDRLQGKQPLLYGLLFASLLLNYVLPAQSILSMWADNLPVAYAILTAITVAPIGMAACVFSTAFARVPNASRALAFNVFGAVIGGLLEYLSSYVGIRNLLLVAAALYAISFACQQFRLGSQKSS